MIQGRGNWSCVLTPPGPGAIGVIRVVGPDALSIIAEFFRPASQRRRPATESAPAETCASVLAGDRLCYGRFAVDDEVVDDVLVSRAPVEGLPAFDISAHGGVRVIERILGALERSGAPACETGESRVAAWPAGNLIEREAVDALSRARSARAVRFVAWQRRHLVRRLEEAAGVCVKQPRRVRLAVERMLARYAPARYLIDGATVAIVGPPNGGKSTLFNHLVGRSAAIVSPRAGTTLDWVTASVELHGVPVTLVDTAGLCKTFGELERTAIEGGWAVAARADACLWVLDGAQPVASDVCEFHESGESLPRRLLVINKIDLGRVWDPAAALVDRVDNVDGPVCVSARTGEGIDMLVGGVLRLLGFEGWEDTAPVFFTHRQAETAARVLSDLENHPAAAPPAIRDELIGPAPKPCFSVDMPQRAAYSVTRQVQA